MVNTNWCISIAYDIQAGIVKGAVMFCCSDTFVLHIFLYLRFTH